MTRNEHTAEEHAGLVTSFNARSFSAVLEEAKITPRQVEICELKFVKGMTNYQIAAELNVSVKTVDKELNTAYKQITNVLSFL